MLTPSTDVEQQQDARYEILAYRIPTLSPAMGVTSFTRYLSDEIAIVSEQLAVTSDDWPRTSPECFAERWLHSDIKNMAFTYVYLQFQSLYNILREAGGIE